VDAAGVFESSNTDPYDSFGFALALSANGNTLAVTATREDSNARGINGNQTTTARRTRAPVHIYPHRRQMVAAGLREVVEC
jgi:hypothetical protein